METAEQLFISQSTLSKNIKSMEEELGIQLFDRSSKKATLSPAGQWLMDNFERILEIYDRSLDNIDEFIKDKRLTININIFPAHSLFLSALKMVEDEFPIVHFAIQEKDDADAMKDLTDGTMDMAIFHGFDTTTTNFHVHIIKYDSFFLAINPSHPLAQKQTVSLMDIKDEVIIVPQKESFAHKIIINAFHNDGIEPNIFICNNSAIAIGLVEDNKGVAFFMYGDRRVYNFNNVKSLHIKNNLSVPTFLVVAPSRNISREIEQKTLSSIQYMYQKKKKYPFKEFE